MVTSRCCDVSYRPLVLQLSILRLSQKFTSLLVDRDGAQLSDSSQVHSGEQLELVTLKHEGNNYIARVALLPGAHILRMSPLAIY